jgi:(S)-2-hydroxyglutarate dehydrogenase
MELMRQQSAFDVAIVGAGILGLTTAYSLLDRTPGLRVVVLEKEGGIARHQTGHNSGVIHMGIYYKPGSLKARLSIEGAASMKQFCTMHGIPFSLAGKVIVATSEAEAQALAELYRRGMANGVPGLRCIGPEELSTIEPYAAGVEALYSPETAIVNYSAVSRVLAGLLVERGVEIRMGTRVFGGSVGRAGATIETEHGPLSVERVVNCAGLYSDIVARRMGAQPAVQIVPFRGEYYTLVKGREGLARGLIYPTPDPRFPFLGVHFTRMIGGGVEVGPNAVPAFAREGYSWSAVNVREFATTVGYVGFQRLARMYWKMGSLEIYRSLSKAAFVKSLQRLVPAVRASDILPGGAGVRAQAISVDGRLLDDFSIVRQGCAVHVLNAPSPAATASFAIGRYIAGLAEGDEEHELDRAVEQCK